MSIIFEVLVVCVNGNGGWGADKEMTPMVEASHQSEEFVVVDVVVTFCVRKGLGVETYGGVFAPMILLREYGSCGEG